MLRNIGNSPGNPWSREIQLYRRGSLRALGCYAQEATDPTAPLVTLLE